MNEDDPELMELQALAKAQDRLEGLPRKRVMPPEVSVKAFKQLGGKVVKAGRGGGKKAIVEIIFGPEGKTQLIFRPETKLIYRPSKDALDQVSARWKVSLKGKTSRYDTQRKLNRSKRGLWDKAEGDEEEGEPSVPFKAARQLLACHAAMEARPEAKAPEDAPYIYPKPELETLREELAEAEDRLNGAGNHLMMAHDAISLALQALGKGLGGKVQMAFKLLQSDKWPQDIDKLQEQAISLAWKLQRPPKKAELRKSHDPKDNLYESDFSVLLKHAGLSWLKRGSG